MDLAMHVILMWMPGATELIVIGLVGLLLFGRRLPEVGRSLGRSIVEFKKGIRDVEDNISVSSRQSSPSKPLPPADKPPALPESPPQDASAEKSEVSSAE